MLEGDFLAGESTGHSTYTLYNGTQYSGSFHKGQRHGTGTIRFAGGAVFEGQFDKDGFGGPGTLFMPAAAGVDAAANGQAEPTTSSTSTGRSTGVVVVAGDWRSTPFKFSKMTPRGGHEGLVSASVDGKPVVMGSGGAVA